MTNQPSHHTQPSSSAPSKDKSFDLIPGDLPSPWSLVRGAFRSKIFSLAALLTLGSAGSIGYHALTGSGSAETSSWSLWAFRVGVSFLAAFLFAFLVRRAIKTALLIGAVLIGGAYLLNKLGLGITKDHLATIKDAAEHSAQYIQSHADSLWITIKSYLPSGGAAGAGLWKGARQSGVTKV